MKNELFLDSAQGFSSKYKENRKGRSTNFSRSEVHPEVAGR